MADNPAPPARRLINGRTFRNNFSNKHVNQTYLCYEVEVWRRDTWAPMEERQGILSNRGRFRDHDCPQEPRPHHAALCFLHRERSWHLDRTKHYRLTWYISWSPCPACAPELAAFLRENSHVSLRILAAGIHTMFSGYERGLHDLREKGAQLSIMTPEEHQHCWETFVDNQGQAFEPWPELDEHTRAQCQILEPILWNRRN